MDHLESGVQIGFLLFPKWLFFQLNFGGDFFFKLDIAFSRYGHVINDIITDQWKVDFEKKSPKVWESEQIIDIQ